MPEKLQMTSDIMLDSFIKLSRAFFYEKGEFDIESRVTLTIISQCNLWTIYVTKIKPKQNLYYKQNKVLGLLWLNFHFVVVGLSSWWTSCSIWSFVQVWSEFLPCSYRRSQGEDPECKCYVTLYLTASEVSRQSTSARTIHLVLPSRWEDSLIKELIKVLN